MRTFKIKTYILYSFLFIYSLYSRAQTYQIVTKDSLRTYGFGILNNENNIFTAGVTTEYGGVKDFDILLLSTNESGGVNWMKLYGKDSISEAINSMVKTKDGNLLFGAYIRTTPFIGSIIKVDTLGQVLWAKLLKYCVINRIIEDNNGNIYAVGTSNLYPFNFLICKLNKNGTLLWSKEFGGEGDEMVWGLLLTENNGILLTGWSDSYPVVDPLSVTLVLKLDSTGNTQWCKGFHLYDFTSSSAQAINITSDGDYIIAEMPQYGGQKQALMKLDKYGNLKWCKNYKSQDDKTQTPVTSNIFELTNNDIVISGGYFINNGNYTVTLLKTDKDGNVKWQRHYSEYSSGVSFQSNGFIPTSDNGFILACETYEPPLIQHLLLIKTDSLGYTGCGNDNDLPTLAVDVNINTIDIKDSTRNYSMIEEDYSIPVRNVTPNINKLCTDVGVNDNNQFKVKNEQLTINPNPATTTIQVETTTNTGTLQITNINGKVVLTKEIKKLKENIDIAILPQGLYFVRAVIGGGAYNGRFVKM